MIRSLGAVRRCGWGWRGRGRGGPVVVHRWEREVRSWRDDRGAAVGAGDRDEHGGGVGVGHCNRVLPVRLCGVGGWDGDVVGGENAEDCGHHDGVQGGLGCGGVVGTASN